MNQRPVCQKTFILTLFLLLLTISSCGKEEFSARKHQDTSTTDPTTSKTTSPGAGCSKFTLVKPKVDYLFLWDNSSSQFWINDQTKAALRNTIELIAYDRFDYRILLAPLIDNTNQYNYLISENPEGLSSSARSILIAQGQASQALDTFPTAAGSERGFERTISLISNNRANGIFRQNAYTIVVLMSNGNVTIQSHVGGSGQATQAHINAKRDQLLSLMSSLQSEQFRFISLVAHSNQGKCSSGSRVGTSYIYMSNYFYGVAGRPGSAEDQRNKDSYDICQMNFIHLFDGLNKSIKEVVQKHVYNYWPFASNRDERFNKNNIKVRSKLTNQIIPQKTAGTGNGFEYAGYLVNHNTRIYPTPGERKTGHMLKLHGSSVVTYPDCLIVTTSSPIDYYGHVHLDSRPFVDSIVLKINGKVIPQSSTNGWVYIGYRASQNIKIKSPTDFSPASPADNKTGYFLKLHGTAIYSNNTEIEVLYNPSSG